MRTLHAPRLSLVSCALAVFVGCASAAPRCPDAPAVAAASAPAAPVVDVATAEDDIAHVLDDWHDAAAHADEARYFGHLSDEAIFMGTDATERWSKSAFEAYAHPHFAKGQAWTFHATRRAIHIEPSCDLAWFDEDLDTVGLGPARGSGILRRVDGAWRIAHYNLAITVPNDRFDATKSAATTAILLRPEAGNLAGFEWLSGSWVGTTEDGTTFEEHWTTPVGGGMLGVGRSTRAGLITGFESLRIEARRNGSVVYVATPRGASSTDFTQVAAEPDALVFENAKHDFPRRISYRRAGDGLRVRLEGRGRAEEWTMARALVLAK